MAADRVREIYEQHIKSLPTPEQLELLSIVASGLAERPPMPVNEPTHSILELSGLGKEIWEGVDAQEYVDRLRDEWNQRDRGERHRLQRFSKQ